jgi:Ethanolamine utilization protein EutJ (predicted chaperonin)
VAMTAYREASFTSIKGGLMTVGYALKDFGGAVVAARTTAGVAEAEPGSGTYGAMVTFPDGFAGRLVWDTGEATPLYASDVIAPAAAAPAADPYILAIQRGDVVEVGQGTNKYYTFLDVDTRVGRVRFDPRPGGGRVVTLDPT